MLNFGRMLLVIKNPNPVIFLKYNCFCVPGALGVSGSFVTAVSFFVVECSETGSSGTLVVYLVGVTSNSPDTSAKMYSPVRGTFRSKMSGEVSLKLKV